MASTHKIQPPVLSSLCCAPLGLVRKGTSDSPYTAHHPITVNQTAFDQQLRERARQSAQDIICVLRLPEAISLVQGNISLIMSVCLFIYLFTFLLFIYLCLQRWCLWRLTRLTLEGSPAAYVRHPGAIFLSILAWQAQISVGDSGGMMEHAGAFFFPQYHTKRLLWQISKILLQQAK